jgi:hypothetical protein
MMMCRAGFAAYVMLLQEMSSRYKTNMTWKSERRCHAISLLAGNLFLQNQPGRLRKVIPNCRPDYFHNGLAQEVRTPYFFGRWTFFHVAPVHIYDVYAE